MVKKDGGRDEGVVQSVVGFLGVCMRRDLRFRSRAQDALVGLGQEEGESRQQEEILHLCELGDTVRELERGRRDWGSVCYCVNACGLQIDPHPITLSYRTSAFDKAKHEMNKIVYKSCDDRILPWMV